MAAGKARGQEAVWRSHCKPLWWDCACPHPWKNPTANPKDSKDTLKMKFECLVQYLRKEGKLPREMEEEIHLWEAGRKSEVFLMTSFSSMLGQTSNLHTLLEETSHRMEESGSSVDISILNDLQSCLTACVNKLESIKNTAVKRNQKEHVSRCAGNKRHCSEKETDLLSRPPCKLPKYSPLTSPTNSSVSASPASISVHSPPPVLASSPRPTPTPSPHVSDALNSDDPSKMLLAVLQQQLLQKQRAKTADATPTVCQRTKSQTLRKVHHRSNSGQSEKRTRVRGEGQCNVAAVVSAPLSACPSATVPHHSVSDTAENSEFRDFLELDLEGSDNVVDFQFLNDCQFLDNLLRETSPDMSENMTTTAVPLCSVVQSVSSQAPVPTGPSVVQSSTLHSNHDPFIGQSPSSGLSESSPFHFDIVSEAVAGGQAESEWTDGGISTAMCSGVGDISRGLQDTEVVSDSGYNSESSVAASHRSSLDSEGDSCPDLDSPDLEAYLNSLEV